MARRRDATDQDLVNTDDGRRGVDDFDVEGEGVLEHETETSFTSLENHLFGSRYFDEADELEGERPDPTTFLNQAPSEADTVVQRNLDEPPPVQVVQVLPAGSRPSLAGTPSLAQEPRAAGGAAGQGLIAAGGVFAGFSVVAAAGVVALGLVCAVVVWMVLRPPAPPALPAPAPVAAPAPADPAPAPPTAAPAPSQPAPSPAAPSPAAPPSGPSPLRDGVRFPAAFGFNDWKPVNVDTQGLFDLLAMIETDCRGPIRITGHTDERGDEQVNDRIAIARAGEVRRLLERQGIDRRRMEVSSANAFRPEVDPIGADGGRTARAQNRRVTLQCP